MLAPTTAAAKPKPSILTTTTPKPTTATATTKPTTNRTSTTARPTPTTPKPTTPTTTAKSMPTTPKPTTPRTTAKPTPTTPKPTTTSTTTKPKPTTPKATTTSTTAKPKPTTPKATTTSTTTKPIPTTPKPTTTPTTAKPEPTTTVVKPKAATAKPTPTTPTSTTTTAKPTPATTTSAKPKLTTTTPAHTTTAKTQTKIATTTKPEPTNTERPSPTEATGLTLSFEPTLDLDYKVSPEVEVNTGEPVSPLTTEDPALLESMGTAFSPKSVLETKRGVKEDGKEKSAFSSPSPSLGQIVPDIKLGFNKAELITPSKSVVFSPEEPTFLRLTSSSKEKKGQSPAFQTSLSGALDTEELETNSDQTSMDQPMAGAPTSLGFWSMSKLEVMSYPAHLCGWQAPLHRVPRESTMTWKPEW
ncbi:PREDICTED: proteoglycan 4-like [Tauraco erythrolophus]|uniref:proteoglycan 4-like n=1 Tax=Tauraco erythrolophus TaxID=121530 RepID=UPI00052346C4|nr:PREDICTED: proteoglycan 4-like [Tauraco erythrolophus]